jgi:hypothetical protein
MDRNNRHIPRIIESTDSRVRQQGRRRFGFSSRQALHYNDHPDAIIKDFDRRDYGAVLREIDRCCPEPTRKVPFARWTTRM